MKIIKRDVQASKANTSLKNWYIAIIVAVVFIVFAVYLGVRRQTDDKEEVTNNLPKTSFDFSSSQENPIVDSKSSSRNVIEVEAEYRARMIDGDTAFFQERNLDKTFAAIITQGDNDGLFTRRVLNNVQNCSDWRASISAIIQNQRDKHFNSDTMDKIQVLKEKCQ